MIITTSVKNGKLDLSDEQRSEIDQYLGLLEGKDAWLVISDKKIPRTLSQNNYYWKILSDYIAPEIGDSAEAVHEDLKEKFLPQFWTIEDGREVILRKSTTRLTTAEFKKFLDQVIAWAASFHNIVVPDSSMIDE